MPRVRFLEDRIVQDEHRHDPAKRRLFKAGEVYDLTEASYQHWLLRCPLEVVPMAPPPHAAESVSSPWMPPSILPQLDPGAPLESMPAPPPPSPDQAGKEEPPKSKPPKGKSA
jgi:hypothetical protein